MVIGPDEADDRAMAFRTADGALPCVGGRGDSPGSEQSEPRRRATLQGCLLGVLALIASWVIVGGIGLAVCELVPDQMTSPE